MGCGFVGLWTCRCVNLWTCTSHMDRRTLTWSTRGLESCPDISIVPGFPDCDLYLKLCPHSQIVTSSFPLFSVRTIRGMRSQSENEGTIQGMRHDSDGIGETGWLNSRFLVYVHGLSNSGTCPAISAFMVVSYLISHCMNFLNQCENIIDRNRWNDGV